MNSKRANSNAKEDAALAKKKKKEKEKEKEKELELIPDVFDPNILVDPKTDVCAMCRGGHEAGLKLKDRVVVCDEDDDEADEYQRMLDADCVLDVNGVWASKYSIAASGKLMKPRLFVHYFCALSSPQVSFNGTVWANVIREIRRGRMLTCKSCGTTGATLGCLENRCNVVMHIPCAVKLGFRRSGFKVAYYCEEHLKANADKELALDRQVAGDISKGQEPVPVTSVNTVDDALVATSVRYTTANLDSDDVTANARSVSADCCSCEGLCDDVATCACLSLGRNYTFTGGLIPGIERRILECNIRCACSVRRCTNRVVERGPTSRLEIFRVKGAQSWSSFTAQENTWGVRTLDFIPTNAFVCEVTGQYVLGRTGEDSTPSGESVAEVILHNPVERSGAPSKSKSKSGGGGGGGGDGAYSGRGVIPVRAWDAPTGTGTGAGSDAGFSSVAWAADQLELGEAELPRSDVSAPIVGASSGASSAGQRRLTVAKLLQSEEHCDAIRSYLRGEVCIDSRIFGNVGSFIRRRPRGAPHPHSASDPLSSSSADGAPPQPPRTGGMLLRRLVYTNKRDSKSGLKLALFAACNIPANTELFI